MKTLLTTLLITITLIATAQNENINISGNHVIENSTGNCYPKETITIHNLNMNGDAVLNISGVDLIITGNMNVNGHNLTIISYCPNFPSMVCVQGNLNIQNGNVIHYTNSVLDCTNLSIPTFDISKDFGHSYTVFDVLGKEIIKGVSNVQMYQDLPRNTFLIVKVEGFKEEKINIR